MPSLHKFFLQFIHSHTFRSSLSSANQLPEVILVQLSSRLHDQKGARSSARLGTFQRSKASLVMYHELSPEIPSASRCLSKQIKSPVFQSFYEQLQSKIPRWISARQNIPKIQFCHPLLQTTFVMFRVFHWADAPSKTLNESPHVIRTSC